MLIFFLIWYIMGFISLFYFAWSDGEFITTRDIALISVYALIGPVATLIVIFFILDDIGFWKKTILKGKKYKKEE